jgi:hypothetical protein
MKPPKINYSPEIQETIEAMKNPAKLEAIKRLPYRKVDEIPFRIEPGRYFYAMFYYPFPPSTEHLLGGNITGLIWHLDDEPESWRVSYRFRYYKSRAIDSEESGDTFSWYRIHTPGAPPDKILEIMQATFTAMRPLAFGNVTPNEPDKWEVLKIEGDSTKYFKIAYERNLHWLHVRHITPEQYEQLTGEKPPTV